MGFFVCKYLLCFFLDFNLPIVFICFFLLKEKIEMIVLFCFVFYVLDFFIRNIRKCEQFNYKTISRRMIVFSMVNYVHFLELPKLEVAHMCMKWIAIAPIVMFKKKNFCSCEIILSFEFDSFHNLN